VKLLGVLCALSFDRPNERAGFWERFVVHSGRLFGCEKALIMAAKKVNDGSAEITAGGLVAAIGKQFRLLWKLNKTWIIFLVISVMFLVIVEVSSGILWSYILCHVVAGFLKWLFLPIIKFYRGNRDVVYRSEQTFYDPKTHKNISFPSLHDPASVDVSMVVPAWNEEKRIPPMLNATLAYLRDRLKLEPSFTYEIIVVNDGSTDKTCDVVEEFIKKQDEGTERIRLLKLAHNRGKGGAVREGVLRSRGRLILMVDADGATEIRDLDKLEASLRKVAKDDNKPVMVVGSRYWLEVEANVTRTPFRKFLMVRKSHCMFWFVR